MTIERALEEGFTHCMRDEYYSPDVIKLERGMELSEGEYLICDKGEEYIEPNWDEFSDGIIEYIAEYYDDLPQGMMDELSDIDYSSVINKVKEVLKRYPYYEPTNIKLEL